MTAKTIVIKIGDAEILIDRKDLKGVDLSNLRVNREGYAVIGKKLLHRIIMNPPANMQVDHKNKNVLDDRRSNLRICTQAENLWNRGKTKGNTAGFKGVSCERRLKRKKYRARITANKKTYYLGNFEKADDAGAAYKKAARVRHGKFARIKDPQIV
jgi:hypothetical protein